MYKWHVSLSVCLDVTAAGRPPYFVSMLILVEVETEW
jgi:hypothetical protein